MIQRRKSTVRFLMLLLFRAVPCNKFYLWADMSGKKTIILREILATSDDSVVGFFVEVDITYPSSLHNSQTELLLEFERILIQRSWLSPYAQSFNGNLSNDCQEKLIETKLDMNRCVCHYRNLEFHINQGLKIQKLHCEIQFHQSKWLGDYISKNTIMRKQLTNDFKKNFYNLMSKACFWKTCEIREKFFLLSTKYKLRNRC